MYYKDWLNEWLETCVRPVRKSSTYDLYCRLTRGLIIPELGGYNLEELSARVLQNFANGLIDRLAANTVSNILNIVKCSLKRAHVLGITETRNTDRIQIPKAKEKEVECFPRAEQRKMETYIMAKGGAKLFGVQLCLYIGLRIGELLALEWSDLDLRRGRISVYKTCRDSWKNGRYEKLFDTPKTPSSVRVIPLPKQFLAVARVFKKKSKSGFVVCDKKGNGVTVRSYQKVFERLQKKLGIPHRGFHSLRHTFATRAIECGVDVKALSEIMGHENPMLTLKRYTHALMPHKEAMMNKLGKVFSEMGAEFFKGLTLEQEYNLYLDFVKTSKEQNAQSGGSGKNYPENR